MGVMETEYKENMTEAEAIALVSKAIEAGIYHDLGSGSNRGKLQRVQISRKK